MKNLMRSFRRISLAIALSLALSHSASANTPGPFGLGIVIGEPTGLSAKLWLDQKHALDFGLSFSFDDYFLIFSDYLFHFPGAFGRSSKFVTELTPYVGIGGVLAFANDRHAHHDRHLYGHERDSLGLGVRVPVGIEWIPSSAPLGVFVELVPGIAIAPATDAFFEGGIGVRYYF